MTDLTRTQHFTTEAERICGNLVKFIPESATLIEPFVGEGNLLGLFPSSEWELFDIEAMIENVVQQDTLMTPPDYSGKWVVTNPPYLARNKAGNKELFDKYGLDDLYKIAITTILDAEGGILILPTNFFTDERTSSTREKFFSRFKIELVNIFKTPAFTSTTYSVSSFAFRKLRATESRETQELEIIVHPEGESVKARIESNHGFRIAGRELDEISSTKPVFSRLMKDRDVVGHLTNIKLYAIDTREARIRLEYDEQHFYGAQTDRSYATFVSSVEIGEEGQKRIVQRFNEELNMLRDDYSDIILTNYRDYNRKRIGFGFAYRLLSKIAKEEGVV